MQCLQLQRLSLAKLQWLCEISTADHYINIVHKMQRDAGISFQVGYVIQAVIVLAVIALPGARWRRALGSATGNSSGNSGPADNVTHEESTTPGNSDGTENRNAGSTC